MSRRNDECPKDYSDEDADNDLIVKLCKEIVDLCNEGEDEDLTLKLRVLKAYITTAAIIDYQKSITEY